MRPAVVTQHPGQRFARQLRAPLLQPEMTADLQQHTPINRIGNLPLLHQALGFSQAIERVGVIALIGSQLRLPEKTIQRTLVLTVQTVLQTGLEEFGGHCILPLTKRQPPALQGNSSQQRRRAISLSTQHFMDIGQQTFGSSGSASQLQQLCMIQFKQAFKQQRTLRTGQAQRLTIEGLRSVKFGVEQGLLGQPGQAQ
ncbi:hypothetical protein D3C84_769770 [compost metagenome]